MEHVPIKQMVLMSVLAQQDILAQIAKLPHVAVLHVKMVEHALTKLMELMSALVLPDSLELIVKLIRVPVHHVKMGVHVPLIHQELLLSMFALASMVSSVLTAKMHHAAHIFA